ncbi:MAG: UvrD-helicase domain-containing protein [Actinomycetaceae bacterium]|nr:UvrD-helicase domain-containing protein [Actinomycetaceae bacterium]
MTSNVHASAGVISELTDEQRLAAASLQTNLFIEAGPGTGKTTVSAQRFGVQRFISSRPYDARAVVAVSFTRAATYNLRQRVQRLWGPTALTWPHRIVTLDTIMCDLLHDLMQQKLVIWPNALKLWPDGNIELDVRDSWASSISTVWSRAYYKLELHEGKIKLSEEFTSEQAAHFPKKDVECLIEQGICTHQDIRDILTLALKEPTSATRVQKRLGDTMRALIVDEVFDANGLDIAIIGAAIAAGVSVTLVGDPWQALYVFRGARPEAIPRLLERAEVATLRLTKSFRWCSKEQHNLANRLRAGKGIILPNEESDIDVALALRWAELWSLGGKVLPLAFQSFKGSYGEAAVTLILNHLTRSTLNLDASYLNDALTALNIQDREIPRMLEPELQDVVETLRPGGKEAAKAAYMQLREVISKVSTRELPRRPHYTHTDKLVQLRERIVYPGDIIPGLTTHQAKGHEWQIVGVRLKPDEREVLAAGLNSSEELHRKIYVACTRARERTIELGSSI